MRSRFLTSVLQAASAKCVRSCTLDTVARKMERNLVHNTRCFTVTSVKLSDRIPIKFVEGNGDNGVIEVKAKLDQTLLEVAREHDIELEGACEGTLACSTCHCVFDKEVFDKLPPVAEEEMDMLDLAAGLTETSRLGCQIKVTETLRGATIRIPDEMNNLYGSGGGRSV